MASLDIKTAFDEARPRHIANIMESHDIHGWPSAALLREMSGLEGKAMFECDNFWIMSAKGNLERMLLDLIEAEKSVDKHAGGRKI